MSWDDALDASLRRLEERSRAGVPAPSLDELGRVRRLGDGVAFVEGLAGAMVDEVVLFANGLAGQVVDVGRDVLGCVLFGRPEEIGAGSLVRRTGRPPAVPVGDGVLGRVLDPLGRPRDDRGDVSCADHWPVEREAPGPLERQPVKVPLLTGVKVIDAVIPIGLGQRELILGDRETGKTSIALDAIINQRESGVRCVYVAIGGKRAAVVEVIDELRRAKALDHTAIVVADASDPVALRYLAPYAGATLAEWFAHRGQHALVVYDDLTRHAEAYRDLSLILRRPPGREAYPGDIFSIHARLLERACMLGDPLGGGSVTALPIIETQRSNLSGFIPTNLVSITDGQVFLDAASYAQGRLPAVDVGRSVSRLGRDVQPGTMRDAGENLRLQIAQYEDVRDFARFGAVLDEATRRQIDRGERIVRVLEQEERDVWSLATEVVEVWALKAGLLDDVAPQRIPAFERQLRARAPELAYLDAPIAAAPGIDEAMARDFRRVVDLAKAGLEMPGDRHGRAG